MYLAVTVEGSKEDVSLLKTATSSPNPAASHSKRKVSPLTAACFENDRNRLREFIISWFLLNSKKQSWYR